jgi:hypothetical protein
MIEFAFVIVILFLIAVLWYKQRRSDLQILQVEHAQLAEQLADLLEEQQPIVIRGTPLPRGLTQDALQAISRLAAFPVGDKTLATVLQSPSLLASAQGTPTLTTENRLALATELSVPIWSKRTWLEHLSSTAWFGGVLGSLDNEIVLGGIGLRRTVAYGTLLIPTEGTYTVTLLAKDSEEFLPPTWENRYIGSFTVNDTPLVNELKYLEIVLRPGTSLWLPRHLVVSIEPKDPAAFSAALVLEYHHPISKLVKSFS